MFEGVVSALQNTLVARRAPQIIHDVMQGAVGVVAAPLASGKTLLLSSMLAQEVARTADPEDDDFVLVLVPRRSLAIDAAEHIAKMEGIEVDDVTGLAVNDTVGYAVGKQAGDESKYTSRTKLRFATYGFALSSGWINTAKNIVLDEVHEAGEDTSLVRAILHDRKKHDPSFRLLEMSATINARKQAGHWNDIPTQTGDPLAVIHEIEGQALTCEERYIKAKEGKSKEDNKTLEDTALDLLENENRRGLVIFRPGVGEIEDTVEELQKLISKRGIPRESIEIAQVYSGMEPEARARAVLPPAPGKRKILIGTNTIESGINMEWVDSGISDGKCKVPYYDYETGAESLALENLPQWRIDQQRGRINRFSHVTGFDSGIFILFSDTPMKHREPQATAEIERVSLNRLMLRAASLGHDAEALKYDADVDPQKLQESKEELIRLELMDESGHLTEDGKYVAGLPLGPEAGAMLCEAKRMDMGRRRDGKGARVLNDTITLAAIVENGGLRADYKKWHGEDETSEALDALKTFRKLQAKEAKGRRVTPDDCAEYNVSWKRYTDVLRLIEDICRRHTGGEVYATKQASDAELQRVMLQGGVNRLFVQEKDAFYDLMRPEPEVGYKRGKASKKIEASDGIAVVQLRDIVTDDGARTIAQNITKVPPAVFLEWAADRGDVLTRTRLNEGGGGKKKHRGRGQHSIIKGDYFEHGNVRIPVPEDANQAHIDALVHPDERWEKGFGRQFSHGEGRLD